LQTLREYINSLVSVKDKEWEVFNKILRSHHYKKGDIINFKDDIWTDAMYINSGIIRSYIINSEGRDFTRQLYFNTSESHIGNLFVIDLTSFITQVSSYRGFEVLEESEVVIFSRKDLYALYDTSKKWERIGRHLNEQAYLDMDRYYYSLLTKTTKERYLYLTKTMAGLIEKVPQYHIASLLGVTPVTLSRIKKEIANTEKK